MDGTQPFLYIALDRQFSSEKAQYVAWPDFSFLCGLMDTIPVLHFKISLYEIGLFYKCMEYCIPVNFKTCPLRKVVFLKYMFLKKIERKKDTSPCVLRFFLYCVGKEILVYSSV